MTDFIKQGWVRFYRKSIDSSVWKNPKVWFVWSWCLMKANHDDSTFPFNGEDITIPKGSFITGIMSAKKELPTLSAQNIRTIFKYLKSTGRITVNSNNKFSIIKVEKWVEYQNNNKQTNKPLTNDQQATNKPLTTNKNVKNVKNVKKDNILPDKSGDYDDFLKWYNLYPRKVGKPKAYQAWKKIKPDLELKKKMVLAVIEHCKSKQWQKEEFIPYPATYLSQRRWEDILPIDEEN